MNNIEKNSINIRNTIELIGQTNRGKSSLFNSLIMENVAITSEEINTTRDYIRFWGENFILTDNMGIDKGEELDERIFKSNILLYVVTTEGFDDIDKEYFSQLRVKKKSFYLIVNKSDKKENNLELWQTSGAVNVYYTSTKNNYGIKELREFLKIHINKIENTDPLTYDKNLQNKTKIALVGGVNSGKSSLLNLLVGYNRSKVSNIAATTRDVVMENINNYLFFDTAGFNNMDRKIEKIAIQRTENIITNVNICLIIIDISVGFSQWNKWLWQQAERAGKGIIFIFNKSDLLTELDIDKKYFIERYRLPSYVPYIFLSTFHKDQIFKLFTIIKDVEKSLYKFITKSQITFFLKNIQLPNNSLISMSYKNNNPQTFIVYSKKIPVKNYQQYLENQLIYFFKFKGIKPVILYKNLTFKS
jgi:GTP-binding protein